MIFRLGFRIFDFSAAPLTDWVAARPRGVTPINKTPHVSVGRRSERVIPAGDQFFFSLIPQPLGLVLAGVTSLPSEIAFIAFST